jgi:capsular polysaccharide export protein
MYSLQLGGWARFKGKSVLLLQGPHGPFFSRVARALSEAGARAVKKINFNGGDLFYYPSKDAFSYTAGLDTWPEYLDGFIKEHQIDCVVVFGDCRPLHAEARQVALMHKIQFWVFEEGYIRPHYITFEQHGVNGYSRLPLERNFYDDSVQTHIAPEHTVPSSFGIAAKYAMGYFTASALAWPWFWRYRHHRSLTMLDGLYWVRSYARKLHYRAKEAEYLDDLKPRSTGKFFLTVLQVASDAQVAVHSPYESIVDFILETIRSFANYAPDDVVLLIKHHPLDRGYTDYTKVIDELSHAYNLHKRVRYIHDQHLPTLLANAEGVVTINSTVGLSALFHGTPVITMGKSVYSLPGLTCQVGLDLFWKEAGHHRPDALLHAKFRSYVTEHTQINGNFYVELPNADVAGVVWLGAKNQALVSPVA